MRCCCLSAIAAHFSGNTSLSQPNNSVPMEPDDVCVCWISGLLLLVRGWLTDVGVSLAFGDSYTYAQGTLGYADSTFIGSNLNFSYTLAQMIQPRTCHCTTSGPYNSLARPDDSCSPASPCSEISSTPTSHSQLSGPRSTILETRQSWTSIFSTYYDRLISTVFEQFVEPGLQGRVQEGVVHETATAGQDHSESCQDGGPACSPNKTMMGWWDGWQSRKPRFSICGAVKCEDVTALVFDSNAFLNRVLDHPAEYNITNTTLRCPEYDQPLLVTQYGGLPVEEYFWYNTGHM